MATITLTSRHGNDTFTFSFSDTLQRLTGFHAETRRGYVLELLASDGTVERSLSIPSGTFDRTFSGGERKSYTLTESITPTGIRMEADGITPKLTVNLPYRIRGA